MKAYSYKLLLLCLSLCLFSCDDDDEGPGENPPCGPVVDADVTAAVVNHHFTGFGMRDVDVIMEDYTEESILVTPDGSFIGLEEIETYYKNLLPNFPIDDTTLDIDILTVQEEIGYVVWHAETSDIDVPLGTDTFVVQDGMIMRQTFVAQIVPK